MANKFAVVGISGIVICVACLAAAAAIGGNQLHNIDFGGWDGPRCETSQTTATRNIAWTGGDSITVALPADAHYQPGVGDQIVVSGDSALLQHVVIAGDEIKLDCRRGFFSKTSIAVTLPGRVFRRFAMAGSGDLTLTDIDQPDLEIRMAGSGDIAATGKTGNLDLKMAGSGDANLGKLAVDRVSIDMAGSGNAEIAPKDELRVFAAGSGDVKLRSDPRTITTKFAGSGELIRRPDNELDKQL